MSGAQRDSRDVDIPLWSVVASFLVGLTAIAWPVITGRTFSLVAYGQSSTYPWGSRPPLPGAGSPQSDQVESSYPWAVFTHHAWDSFQWPLWDPHGYGGGAPFSTDGMGALYPVRIAIDAIFSGAFAHDVFVLLHVALAGIGAYWLSRSVGLRRLGALVAGLGWMVNANMWAIVQLEMLTPFFAWLPLTVAAVDGAIRKRTVNSCVLAAAVLAMASISSNIAYVLLIFLVDAAYVAIWLLITTVRQRDRQLIVRSFGLATSIFCGALLLAGFVLVPTAINLLGVQRQPLSYASITVQLVHWHEYLSSLFRSPGTPDARTMWLVTYQPPAALALAIVAILFGRGRGTWFARALSLVPLLIATGGAVTWIAYHAVPGLTTIVPVRFLTLSTLGICILAGVGADLVVQRARKLLATQRSRFARLVGPNERWGRLVAPFGACLTVLALTLLVAVPGLAADRHVNAPTLRRGQFAEFPATPIIARLENATSADGWPAQVLQAQITHADPKYPPTLTTLVGDIPLVFGLDTWGGYDSAIPSRTAALLKLIAADPSEFIPQTHPTYQTGLLDWNLVSRLGVDLVAVAPGPGPGVGESYGKLKTTRLIPVYSGSDGQLFKLAGSHGGPYLSASATLVNGPTAVLSELRSQGAEDRRAVVIDREDLPRSTPLAQSGARGSILRAGHSVNHALVSVRTSASMWLTMPISYDKGWTASLDGRSLDVVRADYNFIAVRVPQGTHTVAFSYRPIGWSVGWALTGLAAMVALLVVLRPPLSRRFGGTSRDDGHSLARQTAPWRSTDPDRLREFARND